MSRLVGLLRDLLDLGVKPLVVLRRDAARWKRQSVGLHCGGGCRRWSEGAPSVGFSVRRQDRTIKETGEAVQTRWWMLSSLFESHGRLSLLPGLLLGKFLLSRWPSAHSESRQLSAKESVLALEVLHPAAEDTVHRQPLSLLRERAITSCSSAGRRARSRAS